ncbi:type I polyketide synthase [Micromonospora sp. WMMD987]|uniref:type I polyketide synthase n=1 Tax=Micromonospora sp. WMMD987 TaxID=3016089 RepID=UPI0032B429E9
MNAEEKLRYFLKRVTNELQQTRDRLSEVEEAGREPIAIVGMACRFPGGVSSPEDLWTLLEAERSAVTDFPADRGWDVETLYDPEPGLPGHTYTRTGGFLDDVAGFDAAFFGISPREALAMDPQQRLLLETSWEAIERAGLDPQALRGSRTGVFAGLTYHDYATGLAEVPDELQGFLGNGNAGSVASGRVSYTFGFEGPAVTVDTACSSSLVALHLAVQSLRLGECDLALAGGVTVMATPGVFVEFSRQRGLAVDGRCKSFAAGADGTGWSEGVGVVLVERLSVARERGHRVLAVVRGSAVNQDGASNGLTAPNGPSQQRVIRQALGSAGLSGVDVDVVEGHGTGTRLGDPIEAQAVLGVYGQGRVWPLLLGSVKSNIGHTQAAAGVAGVIKMVLAMRHGVVPRSLHIDAPTPQVDWSAGAVELAAVRTEWPGTGRPRRAGVSSFGVSGTNAHVILEQAPEVEGTSAGVPDGPVAWMISGRSAAAVHAQARRIEEFVRSRPHLPVSGVAAGLARRALLPYRAVGVGETADELLGGLGEPVAASSGVEVGFLFSGQGSQRSGMGLGLAARFPTFAEEFARVCGLLEGFLPRPLGEVVAEGGALLDRTRYAQPALFAVQVAQVALLRSFGVRPSVVVGHSVGEYAAAVAAGVLDLADACRLVAARAALMDALPAGGAMLAVRAGETVVAGLGLDVAAVNGPDQVVLSGVEAAVDAAAERLSAAGVRVRRLRVSHAFHSALMEPMLAEFARVAESVEFRSARVPMVSSVETGADMTVPDYWVRQIRDTVRFADAMAAVDTGMCLEVGPDAALAAMLPDRPVVPVSRRDVDEVVACLTAVGVLHTTGVAVDWTPVSSAAAAPDDLPTYAFQHRRYWLDAGGWRGSTVRLADGGVVVSTRISTARQPWLADHVVDGSVLVPGTGFVDWAIHAGDLVGAPVLRELTVQAPLVLDAAGTVDVQTTVDGRRQLSIHARRGVDQPWTCHATGQLADATEGGTPQADATWPPAGATPMSVEDFYERLAGAGLQYGPVFQGLRAAWRVGAELVAEVALDDAGRAQADRFGVHPALLDAALHLAALDSSGGPAEPLLPFAWQDVAVHATGATKVRVRMRVDGDTLSLTLSDTSGAPVATVGSLALRGLPDRLAVAPVRDLYTVDWVDAGQVGEREADLSVWDCAGVGLAGVLVGVQERLVADERRWLVLVPGGQVCPDAAAVWGLLASAQTEHPGRLVLVDTVDPAVARAAAAVCDEPQLRVDDDGRVRVPRLVRAVPAEGNVGVDFGAGPVLVTGGTGTLGGLLARHLVRKYGVDDLVLVSRRGPDTPGVDGLVRDLPGVRVVACDVTDRVALAGLLGEVRPRVVVHAAGILDDATVGNLTVAQVESVFRVKAVAARYLHELVDGSCGLVFFSSASGVFGSAGQANYAAANAYLDALARQRRAQGLPGQSLAWGLWASASTLARSADRDRLARSGVLPIDDEQGLRLFDAALRVDAPVTVPVRLRLNSSVSVPPLLSRLVPTPRRTASAGDQDRSVTERYAGWEPQRRRAELVRQVCTMVAGVLGFGGGDQVDAGQAFRDMGLDSLTAVELRNRLTTWTGVRLPATLVFDYPSPVVLAGHLDELLFGAAAAAVAAGVGVGSGSGSGLVVEGDPVVIVGMACRYPGGVWSPEDLWDLVVGERDAVGGFPVDRGWDLGGLFDADPDRVGTSYAREGGFLYGAGDFDAGFFGVSPREALAMDPQQRLLLEVSWEVLERAGIDPLSLRGSRTGVFTGLMYHDYLGRMTQIPPELEGHMGNGNAGSIASGRVAYTFGFEGPAVTIDTACSSSLVALHLAVQSLRSGECDLALAGGVAVMATPGVFVEFSRQRGLAVDGRCKSFAAGADGTGWSEGVGVVLVERLSVARERGHRVLAVVRGSAVNQDGASNGLTAPNGPSQQRVIRQALASAGLSAVDVDVVEGHGTGTRLGDPIEAQAVLGVYGQGRVRPLLLGSVKSNLGHTQAAAGVAGVIKMVLAMRHGVVPRSLHVDAPTPQVDWSAGAVELAAVRTEWPGTGRPRRAGVSSFGVSGTNAHVILEQAPDPEWVPVPSNPGSASGSDSSFGSVSVSSPSFSAAGSGSVVALSDSDSDSDSDSGVLCGDVVVPAGTDVACVADADRPVVWLVSGRSWEGLVGQVERLEGFVSGGGSGVGVGSVAVGLWGRALLPFRAVGVGGSVEELLEGLRGSLASGSGSLVAGSGSSGSSSSSSALSSSSGSFSGSGLDSRAGSVSSGFGSRAGSGGLGSGVVFVFPGQGWQWEGMACRLLVESGVFAESMGECDRVLRGWVGCSVVGVLLSGGVVGGDVRVVQPLMWAVMVSLARVWGSLGVVPVGVVGHSQGEVAAAVVAGVLSLEEGARVVAVRAGVVGEFLSGGGGGMLSVWLSVEEVRLRLVGVSGVSVAAVNGPGLCVVSGDRGVLGSVDWGGARVRWVDVDYASHSVGVDVVEGVLRERLGVVGFRSGVVPWYSTVRGGLVDGGGLDGGYWFENLRGEVCFEAAVRAAVGDGVRGFVEVSGHPVLLAGVVDVVPGGVVTGTLRRGEGGMKDVLRAAGVLHVAGVAVDWGSVMPVGVPPAEVPTYAFQRERFWLDGSIGNNDSGGGGVVRLGDGGVVVSERISVGVGSWWGDHVVNGVVLVPGAQFVEWVVGAGDVVGLSVVRELMVQVPLVLEGSGFVEVQTVVGGDGRVGVYSRNGDGGGGDWVCHATGLLAETVDVSMPGEVGGVVEVSGGSSAVAPVLSGAGAVWPPVGAVPVSVDGFYERLAGVGLEYGPVFRGLRAAWRVGGELVGEVALDDVGRGEVGRFGVHPALLDAALHVAGLRESGGPVEPLLPFAWQDVVVHATGATEARVWMRVEGDTLTVTLTDRDGAPVVTVGSLALRPLSDRLPVRAARDLYTVDWVDAGRISQAGEASQASQVIEAGRPGQPGQVGEVSQFGGMEADLSVWDCAGVGLADVLAGVQERLVADERRWLVLVAGGRSVPDAAAVWGLLASAQTEHPGRLVLVDAADPVVARAAVGVCDEPQLWVDDDGRVRVPRLVRAVPPEGGRRSDLSAGPVLITGGTGTLGGLLARHLVDEYGVDDLVLVSRRGPDAPGAEELARDLPQARIVAGDISDRDCLRALLDEFAPRAIIHAAGVLDDATIANLTPERLETVFAAKARSAYLLHELTRDRQLDAFVLFSSAAGVFGSAGQANYAAANAYLDALARQRRAQGLPAQSLAWGLWETRSAMTAAVGTVRSGVVPLTERHALALFDAALDTGEPVLLPVRLHLDSVPPTPLIEKLKPTRRSTVDARPAPRTEDDFVALVRTEAAAVLGHRSGADVDPDGQFTELGFDSLAAIRLRNQLGAATGVRLTATAVFDHPTARALAAHLYATAGGAASPGGSVPPVDREETLGALFRDAVAAGRRDDGFALLSAVARLRPGFRSPTELTEIAAPLRLAEGPARPRLVCVPSPMGLGGAHQYARLATALRGVREVHALPIPGFRSSEALPESPGAVVEWLAASLGQAVGDEPYALVGYSSGGLFAHGLAGLLEERGRPAAGLVLLDTYLPDSVAMEGFATPMLAGLFAREESFGPFTSARLSAMGRYVRLIAECEVPSVTTPTLFVRPTDLFRADGADPDVEPESSWRATWPSATATAEVAGNHFTMLESGAVDTARVIDDWLVSRIG